jgi:hypothetical protein
MGEVLMANNQGRLSRATLGIYSSERTAAEVTQVLGIAPTTAFAWLPAELLSGVRAAMCTAPKLVRAGFGVSQYHERGSIRA